MAKDQKAQPDVNPAAAPAEAKIPFQEFAADGGADRVLLAGFQADWQERGEPTHRTKRDWQAALAAFAAMTTPTPLNARR